MPPKSDGGTEMDRLNRRRNFSLLVVDFHIDTNAVLLSGCDRERANRTDRLATFPDDATGVVRVQPNAIEVSIPVPLVQNTGLIWMSDQLDHHIFQKFLDREFRLHVPRTGNSASAESFTPRRKPDELS